MAIILNPALFGLEGEALEPRDLIAKINGFDITNCIVSVGSVGHNREDSEWVKMQGQKRATVYTRGMIVPKDMTLTILAAGAALLKQTISPIGKWAETKFTLTIQFAPPLSALPGLPSILSLPTLTWTMSKCLLMSDGFGSETGAIKDEWTIRIGELDTPAGLGT